MKVCTKCGKEKDAEEFGWSSYSKQRGGGRCRRAMCRACTSAASGVYRQKQKKLWDAALQTACDYKCAVCGFDTYIESLDFHHVESSDKTFQISSFIFIHKFTEENFEIVKNELKKCIVLCANCHRAVHFGKLSLDLRNA